MPESLPTSTTGLVLVAAMLVVPQFTLIHPYLHLLIIAPLLVWTGCQNALVQAQKSPEDSQARPCYWAQRGIMGCIGVRSS